MALASLGSAFSSYLLARSSASNGTEKSRVIATFICISAALLLITVDDKTKAAVALVCFTFGMPLLWAHANILFFAAVNAFGHKRALEYACVADREAFLGIGRVFSCTCIAICASYLNLETTRLLLGMMVVFLLSSLYVVGNRLKACVVLASSGSS